MQNKLLPCPFCGGEVFVEAHKFWDEKAKDFTVQTYGVACHQCGSKSWQHCRTEEDAIKHWNTRKPFERIVEQLEDKKWDIHDWRDRWRNEIIDECIGVIKGGVDNAE